MDFEQYVVVRLVRPPDWSALPDEEEPRIQDAHLANIASLHDQGLLLAAGPSAEEDGFVRGYGVMTCDLDTAVDLWSRDPGVVAKRFAAECTSWLVPKGMVVDGPGAPPRSVAEAMG